MSDNDRPQGPSLDEHPKRRGMVDKSRRKWLKATAAAGLALPTMKLAFAESASSPGEAKSDATTLVIASHPYPEKSVINKALWSVAETAPGVRFRRLEALYGNHCGGIDVAAETKAYEGINRVVFMFPIHWYSFTPMLKAYLNDVWHPLGRKAFPGKQLLVVATCGGKAENYSREGAAGHSIQDFLAPLSATASYEGMTFEEPLAFYGVGNADEKTIRSYQDQLVKRLSEA